MIFLDRPGRNYKSMDNKYLSIWQIINHFTAVCISLYYLFQYSSIQVCPMSHHAQHRYQLWGWILFIGSAIFFMASSIRADDPVSLMGGTLFLLACFVFLVPLVAELKAGASNSSQPRRYFRYLQDWFRAVNSRSRAPGARWKLPAPERQPDQIQPHSVRSELRFFASTR